MSVLIRQRSVELTGAAAARRTLRRTRRVHNTTGSARRRGEDGAARSQRLAGLVQRLKGVRSDTEGHLERV
jgi:hypothetical protein